MIEIIPAVLPVDERELKEKTAMVAGQVKWLQMDLCDGIFVPSKSWPYSSSHQIEKIELPFQKELTYEIDVMTETPTEELIDQWIIAGASRFIIHLESLSAKALSTLIAQVHAKSTLDRRVEIGLAVGVETSVELLMPYLEDIEVVQCMGISRIGYQGQEFAGEIVLAKIRAFHDAHPEIPISVDGGVNLKNIHALIEAGASRFIIGSAIFGHSFNSVSTALKNFKEII